MQLIKSENTVRIRNINIEIKEKNDVHIDTDEETLSNYLQNKIDLIKQANENRPISNQKREIAYISII